MTNQMVLILNYERISRIQLLMSDENLVNIVWVCGLPRELVPQHLENMFEASSVVDVDIRFEFFAVCKKRQLQISILL